MKLKKPHFVPILEGPKTPEQDFSQKNRDSSLYKLVDIPNFFNKSEN